MARYEFKLPDIGEGIAECEIAQWRVAAGEMVKEDQPLVDMLTEKAAVEIPSPRAGKILELRGAAGDKVAVGSVLLVMDAGEGAASAPASAPAAAAAAPVAVQKVAVPVPAAPRATVNDNPMASPSVRRHARELGLKLEQVPGSGKGGRITHEDLEACARGGQKSAPAPAAAKPAAEKRSGVEDVKIIGLRRKIAEAMQRSKQRIPHFAYVEEVDVTELEALRQHLNAGAKGRAKLTLLPFLMRALVKAVPEFPNVNGTYDDEAGVFHRHAALHVGIAAQTPQGLIVPVVRHAEAHDVWSGAAEIKRLAEAARAGKATREELSGSTITISSLGPMGGIVSTPIINAPEVAIVGVNKMVERPMVFNGQIAVRKVMNLSSSFDHRIVDGWDAASFIQRLKALLEHPATLFMAE